MALPIAITLSSFSLTSPNNADNTALPYNFKLAGSPDGTTWNLLYTGTAVTFSSGTTQTFSISTSNAYASYRLVALQTSPGIGAYMAVGEMVLNTSTTMTLYPTPTDQTNSTNRVDITATTNITSARFEKNFVGNVFQSRIVEVKSSKYAQIATVSGITTSNARYITKSIVVPRNDGSAQHRPYDGGVMIVPSNNPNASICRQTRTYFRYQSGKGIQISQSVNFSAPIDLQKYYRISDTTAYCVTRYPHRLVPGVSVTISGADSTQPLVWNGTFAVATLVDDITFTVNLTSTPSDFIAGGYPSFTVDNWVNSVIRTGLFDDQNGMFFEYDGSRMSVNRRSSTQQLPGYATVVFGSSQVLGTDTDFTSQLSLGGFVVIKGQTYRISAITGSSEMYIQPAYRGISNTNVIMNRTVETKIYQSDWNIDTFDGNGPSGYSINIHKVQMVYIDYSWYGAGAIRFGMRTTDGKIKYCHNIVNNNLLSEAYMRSGNLPARYEVRNIGVPTYVPALMHWGTSIIMDGKFDSDRSYFFTASSTTLQFGGDNTSTITADTTATGITAGTVKANGTNTQAYRLTCASYAAIVGIPAGTLLTGGGLTVGTVTVGQAATSTGTTGYLYISQPRAAGGTTTTAVTVGAVDPVPIFIPLVTIRISPSVDNGRTGVLGARELVNKMQLQLKDIGILASHDAEIQLILNGYPFTKSWKGVNYPSLSQLVLHGKNDSVDGGLNIFTFRASGGQTDTTGKRLNSSTSISLADIIGLNNSILGGDQTFPNGPDILTVGAKVLDFTGISQQSPLSITARISWTESQA